MKNSAFIKKNYKQSTISRMKLLYGFKTLKDIDNSLVVTEALKKFEVFGNNPRFVQEILFDQIDNEIKFQKQLNDWNTVHQQKQIQENFLPDFSLQNVLVYTICFLGSRDEPNQTLKQKPELTSFQIPGLANSEK